MRAILTYHAIDHGRSVISVTPETFAAHMESLVAAGVLVLPLEELLSAPPDRPAVSITFDDALASIGEHALPILARVGFPATVFVATQHAGGDNRWGGHGDTGIADDRVLDWDALGRLQQQGIRVESHTRRHPHLTRLDQGALAEELEGSAEDIERRLGRRPCALAYPYGDVDTRVAAAAATVYALGCTTDHQLLGPGADPLRLPRLDAWYFKDPRVLREFGSPRFARRVSRRHLLRRIRRAFT